MRIIAALTLIPLLLARELSIKQGKLSISSPDGLSDASYSIDPLQPLPPISLTEQTTLKVSFTVIDSSTNEGLSPDQAHLLFEDHKSQSGEGDVIMNIGVKSNGRASFTLNTAKLPPALIHSRGTSNLTLFISSLSPEISPISIPLTSLTIHPSLLKVIRTDRHAIPPRAGEPAFRPQEELAHTFKVEEKSVGAFISLIGLGITLSPWLVLVAMLGNLKSTLNISSPSPTSSAFLLTLVALELLITVYWIGLKLYQLLPAFIGLAGVSAYVGKVAMSAMREKRLKGQ